MNALEELRQREQWVCWRTVERDGKPTKVPYQPNGREARSNDPATWSSYAAVAAAADRFDGIGYVFSAEDPYTGIDIDEALVDGALHPGAIDVVQALRSYTEWSPSGVGVHVLVQAHKPDGSRSATRKTPWGDELAVYDRLRYFAITGRRLPTLPDTIEPRQAEIEALLARFMPSSNGTGARGGSANNGDRRAGFDPDAVKRALADHPGLETLVERTGVDPSADDYALAAAAARDGLEPELIEQLLLYRLERRGDPKGKAHRRDYVPNTVKKAIADVARERRDEQLGDPLAEASEIIGMREVPLIAAEEQRGGRVVLERQDGLELHAPTLETLAKFDRLCAALGAQFGHRLLVARDRKTSTAVGFVSALRRYFGPGHVRASEERIEGWIIDLIRLVGEVPFEAGDAQSRLRAWQALDEIDPADGMSATGYARKVKLAHDTTTGDRYLRASWVQEYLRRCGVRGNPEQTAGVLEAIGLEQPNPRSEGRVRARWRAGDATLVLRFWVISAPDYERWRA